MILRAKRSTGKAVATAICAIVFSAAALHAHDFFFRTDSFFAPPNSAVRLRALNGTFSQSENSISRDRLRDLSIVSSSGRDHPDTLQWSVAGDTSVLSFRVGRPGTYVVGASLRPREITLKATDFNSYLSDDGIPDVLAARRKNNQLDRDATERYSKHIKALIQVGSVRSGDFSAVLDYPAELVPLDNPYALSRGASIRVRALVDGRVVPHQLVVAGGRTPSGSRFREQKVRTNSSGVARIPLNARGQWYIKFIRMVPFTGTEKIDYESKWATLTFEVK